MAARILTSRVCQRQADLFSFKNNILYRWPSFCFSTGKPVDEPPGGPHETLDAAFSTLTRSMNVRMIRQSMLNNNLANVDTPTYVPQEVDFNAAMAQSIPEEERTLSGTQNAHIEDMPDSAERCLNLRAVTAKSQPSTIAAPNRALMAIRWTLILPCPTSLKTRFNTMPPPAPSRKLSLLKYVSSDGSAG